MSSDAGTPTTQGETQRSWRMADQYFVDRAVEITTLPNNDGYVMAIRIGDRTQRVFFDPAGRVTHTLPGR